MSTIFAFVVVLGILIFFHELGHFLVARLFDVGVEKFSLGFGPKIFGKKVGITDYRVSAIPLGGYVKMVGEEPDAEIDPADIPISFTHKHVFKRIMIVAAGPFFNLLLAVIIFFGIFQIAGTMVSTPLIGDVKEKTPAYEAGLQKGDVIVAIDGTDIGTWEEMAEIITSSEGRELAISVKRESAHVLNIAPQKITPKNIFGEDAEHYMLEKLYEAGLQKGDVIVAIDGTDIGTWEEMAEIITSSEGRELAISVKRESAHVLNIAPQKITTRDIFGEDTERYVIGITSSGEFFSKSLNPFEAISESVSWTYKIAELTVVSIAKMIQGTLSTETIGGPIMIAQMAGQQAEEGPANFVFFIAVLSVNLAILNFLPIPILDGGHLVFFFIEAAIGRPVNTRMREIAQQVGLFVLILLMIFVFYNDITRVFFNNAG